MTALDERHRLAALARYDIIDVDAPERVDLDALCELAAQLSGVPTAVINLIDDRFQHQIATFGCEPTICSRADSMCYVTILHGEDVAISDASRDERYRDNPWVDGRLARVGFYTSTILRSPDGLAIGTLCVFDEKPRPVVHADQARAADHRRPGDRRPRAARPRPPAPGRRRRAVPLAGAPGRVRRPGQP